MKFKKVIGMTVAAAMLMQTMVFAGGLTEVADGVVAYPAEGGNIYIATKDLEGATAGGIVGCDDTVTSVDVPESVDGVKVLYISPMYMPFSKLYLDSITFPEGFESITSGNFVGAKKFVFNGLTSLGSGAINTYDEGTVLESVYCRSDSEIIDDCVGNSNWAFPKSFYYTDDGKQNEKIPVYVNGKEVEFSLNPRVIGGSTFVPMRAVFEALGADVSFDTDTKTVYGKKGNDTIEIKVVQDGNEQEDMYKGIKINGETTDIFNYTIMINETVFVPLRVVSEAFGANVTWDAETKTVNIVS